MFKLHAVVVMPPPHTGMTIATRTMCAAFAESCDFYLHPTRRDSRWGELRWRIQKHVSLLRSVGTIPRASGPKDSVYFVPDSRLGLLTSCLLAFAARLKGYRLIVHHHVWSYVRSSTPLSRALFSIAGENTIHIALCESMAESIRNLYGSSVQSIVVDNVDLLLREESAKQTSERHSKFDNDRLNLGMLGNLTLEKGVSTAIDVLSALVDKGQSVSLHLGGPLCDESSELLSQVAHDGQLDINTTGPIYGFEKKAFLTDLDLLLFPSNYVNEADPLVVWEALLTGTPVVSTNVGCLAGKRPGLLSFRCDGFLTGAVDLCLDLDQLDELTSDAQSVAESRVKSDSLNALLESLN